MQTIEATNSDRDVRTNLDGESTQRLCNNPDGSLCFLFASDGYVLFHGHAPAIERGEVLFQNLYSADQLGSTVSECGDSYIVGIAGGSMRLKLDGERYDILKHVIGEVLPSLLLSEDSK